MARLMIALAGLALAAGCSAGAAPPAELGGLWSAGPAACEAGVGVRFAPGAIVASYQGQNETLFLQPRYQVLADNDAFRVRIEYALPGGARVGGRGVLVLALNEDGSLTPETHTMLDARTGAARTRLIDDPAKALLALSPCGPARGRGVGLRGFTAR